MAIQQSNFSDSQSSLATKMVTVAELTAIIAGALSQIGTR
jgi:hypothetical protein